MEFFIPGYPPSANRLWGYGNGRVYRTKEYRDWLKTASLIVRSQRFETIDQPYKISIQLRRDAVGMDLDNCIKPINDLMQKSGVVSNDKLTDMVSARWVTFGYDGVVVQITAAGVE
jgi:Holliday junction resolvase RusA-like endonuclease